MLFWMTTEWRQLCAEWQLGGINAIRDYIEIHDATCVEWLSEDIEEGVRVYVYVCVCVGPSDQRLVLLQGDHRYVAQMTSGYR